MKKNLLFGLTILVVLVLTGCKSKESNFRKAYDRAKAAELAQQTDTEPVSITPVVTPVATQPTVGADEVANTPVREERVSVLNGGTLKAYSVVCGAFGSLDNANKLRNELVNAGYSAQIAFNEANKQVPYRVVATTFDDKASAVSSRNTLRNKYSDAWILYRTY